MKQSQALLAISSVLIMIGVCQSQQVVPKTAQPVDKTFSVNGKTIQTSLMQIDNQLYVSLEDLASGLDGSVITKTTSVNLAVLTNNDSQKTISDAVGTVKGTFTFYFNRNYGNRPDVGAKVWIIKSKYFSIPETTMVLGLGMSELLLEDENKKRTTLPVIARAVADGSGVVTIPNVPAGEYIVVMQSSHAKGSLGEKAVTRRDYDGRFMISSIKIIAGQVVDISTDFGMTSY